MIRPRDIHLLALDCEPVWLRKFCGQRHGFPANSNSLDHTPGNLTKALETPAAAPHGGAPAGASNPIGSGRLAPVTVETGDVEGGTGFPRIGR